MFCKNAKALHGVIVEKFCNFCLKKKSEKNVMTIDFFPY